VFLNWPYENERRPSLHQATYTPLWYPGGKTSLFRFFEAVISENALDNVTYIEPYAGGAGAGGVRERQGFMTR
jgi:DNA adenine methylase